MDRTTQHLHSETEFTSSETIALEQAIKRLETSEPVQYVTGLAPFYGMMLKVNPDVLIPRHETEELVALAINFLNRKSKSNPRILDICTGSGCIAIILKKHFPEAAVSAIDISKSGLETATENTYRLLGENAIHFVESDFLSDNSWASGEYDFIISNPPYVTIKDGLMMHSNVIRHEPHLALFVPDEDPLVFYRALAYFGQKYLAGGGLLCMEINERLGERLVELFMELNFGHTEIMKDLNGKDRMMVVSRGGI